MRTGAHFTDGSWTGACCSARQRRLYSHTFAHATETVESCGCRRPLRASASQTRDAPWMPPGFVIPAQLGQVIGPLGAPSGGAVARFTATETAICSGERSSSTYARSPAAAAKHRVAFLSALPLLNADGHPSRVDVGDAQAQGLVEPQARSLDSQQHRAASDSRRAR